MRPLAAVVHDVDDKGPVFHAPPPLRPALKGGQSKDQPWVMSATVWGTGFPFPTFITCQAIDPVEIEVMHMQNEQENNLPTYTVTVADQTGDTQVQMTRPEIVATATESKSWVFVDDRLVDTSALTDAQLNAADAIRLMPGLVGGQ